MWRELIFWPVALILLLASGLIHLISLVLGGADELISRASGALSDWAIWNNEDRS